MDKCDKMTNETLNKAYADFLEDLKKEADKKKSYDYDLTVADFNMFLENCKKNVIEDANKQKTASILSRTIATNYDEKEIKLLIEYLQEMLKKESD